MIERHPDPSRGGLTQDAITAALAVAGGAHLPALELDEMPLLRLFHARILAPVCLPSKPGIRLESCDSLLSILNVFNNLGNLLFART